MSEVGRHRLQYSIGTSFAVKTHMFFQMIHIKMHIFITIGR